MNSFLEDIEFASKVNEEIKRAEQRGIDNSLELTKEMIKQQYGDIEKLKKALLDIKELQDNYLEEICNVNVDILDLIIDLQQGIDKLTKKCEILEENNKLLIQQKAQMYEDLDIAYGRIDKAIEYIKNSIDNTGWLEIGSENVKELLEILGDKENDR